MKDRNAVVSAASKKSNRRNNNSGTLATTKFNKKNAGTSSHESSASNGSGGGGGSAIREPNEKSRRTARSYNPDNNNKKSHLPFDTKHDDDVDGGKGDSSRRSNSGSGTNRRKLDANENVNDDNVDIDDNDDDGDGGDGDDDNDRKIGFASFSVTESNLSHTTWRTDNQRISKRQSDQRNIKYDNDGSVSHKTHRQDANKVDARHQKIASPFESLLSPASSASSLRPSTLTPIASEIKFSIEHGTNRGRNGRNVDSNEGGASAPSIEYLRSGGGDVDSRVTSSNAMLVNNNNHLNNNNAIVDTFDAPPTAMELECVAGYDGGLPQYFLLEAYDSRTKKLRLNISSAFSDVPLFRIDLTGLSIIFFSIFFFCSFAKFVATPRKIIINNNRFVCN